MGEVNNKHKYLDLEGLKKYDELIKNYIEIENNEQDTDISNLLIDVAALKLIDHNAYITADEELKSYVDGKLVDKQDVIKDLETIRSGASLGSTALQEVPAEFVTEDELSNMDYTTTSQVEGIINDSIIIATDSDIDNVFK
jgi:hypothetical protein